ncbi:TPA: poly(glycerol-phosphate) alpha-glucosyltransferase [Staphylococcus aureus]
MFKQVLNEFDKNVPYISKNFFISLGTQFSKATIKHIKKSHNRKKEIIFHIEKFKKNTGQWPDWVKIDFVTKEVFCPFDQVMNEMINTRRNYIDFGISLDKNWIISFLPEVINANAFVRPKKGTKKQTLEIATNNINHYLKNYTNIKKSFSIDTYQSKDIIRFDTKGYLLTTETFYELENEGGLKGIRKVQDLNKEINYMIANATHYLNNELQPNGKYEYGKFPHFDRNISFYNILRHCSSTYSLIEGLHYLKEDSSHVEKAFDYIHKNAYFDCGSVAYIYDSTQNINEIKLGQNAAYIFAAVEYIKHNGPHPHLLSKAQKVAEGILTMINANTMETYHVLNYPDLSIKEKYRIIYYDGETALALLRLYQLDKNNAWLDAVVSLFDKFIAENYWKYHDHWLSYCTNEIINIKCDTRYIEFGLKNTSQYLNFIYNRETTFPTFLEMLTATYELIEKAKTLGYNKVIKEHINESLLLETIHHRANYQRSGYFYPEVAMYFKHPKSILGSFFIKHHGYRVRIDDIEHYISGYIKYQELFNSQKC